MGTITLSSTNKPVYTGEFPSVAVEQFFANVYIMAQQQDSRLGGNVTRKTLRGRFAHFTKIKPVDDTTGVRESTAGDGLATANQTTGSSPQEQTSRWQKTRLHLTEWAERRATARRWEFAHPFEDDDTDRALVDPQFYVTQEAIKKFNRNLDEVIIAACLGDSLEVQRDTNGDESSTTVAFGSGVTDGGIVDEGGGDFMTLDKLRYARKLLKKEDNDLSREMPILVISADEEYSLLGENRVVSNDYSAAKPLESGDLPPFYGCRIITTELLTEIAGVRDCFLYLPSGIYLAIEDEMFIDYGVRRDLNVVDQVFMKQRFGCIRMEEAKVIKIQCKSF